jgi:signal peptide peptidase SppA
MQGSDSQGHLYPNVLRAVRETPWAILPSKLAVITDLLAFRDAGGRLTDQEIRDRIGAVDELDDDARARELGATHRIAVSRNAARSAGYIAGTVAVLPLQGVLMPRAGLMTQYSGGTSVQDFVAGLQAAVANDNVGAVLIDINSPGGSTDMIPEAAQAIRDARGSKPIEAVANCDAASAAYWLGSQADSLSVTPSGMVGSVGIICCHQEFSGQLEQEGVTVTLIHAGRFKTEGNPYEPLTEAALANLQATVDEYYGMFVGDVAKGRGVSNKAVLDGYGEGRMLTAAAALDAGMVDRVETFDDAFARLARGSSNKKNGKRAEDTKAYGKRADDADASIEDKLKASGELPAAPVVAVIEPIAATDEPEPASGSDKPRDATRDEHNPWALTQALNETLTKEN